MLIPIICGALLAVMALSQSAYAGAECASLGGACDDDGWDPMDKLYEIGKPIRSQEQTSAKWPEKSRAMRWNMGVPGSEDEENKVYETPEDAEAIQTAQNVQNATPAKAAENPANTIRSLEAKAILAPLDSITDADILLDMSVNSSTRIACSMVIPYMEFDVQAGVLKPMPEISEILDDAGISREDPVVIYEEYCLAAGSVCGDLRLLDDEGA